MSASSPTVAAASMVTATATSASASASASAPEPLDINCTAPAVIEWKSSDATHYLSDPDPRNGDLVFESRFFHESSCGFFKLCIPIRLKGIDCDTQVILLIHPHSIASLEHESFPIAPDAVQKKLNCSTICLRFRLHRPIDVVVPVAVPMPLQPKRRPSGEVLDGLRSLVRVTDLAVYVPSRELPKPKVEAVCDAISQARLQPLERQDDLASLYSGGGGKIIDLSLCPRDSPPSYEELEPPPPMAPLSERHESKKRRLDARGSSDESESRFDAIWAELIKMRKDSTRYEERIQHLEGRVEQLEKEKEAMGLELAALRSGLENTNDDVQVVEVDVLDLRQGLGDLEEQVDCLRQNGLDSDVEERITECVTDRVFENIMGQSFNTTITFERHGT